MKYIKKGHTNSRFLCCGGTTLKAKTKFKIGLVGVLSIAAGVQAGSSIVQPVTADANTDFEVNVVESLSVTVTTDSSESTGGMNTLLRSPVTVDVTSNNNAGFTASMYASGSTSLSDGGSNTIDTLASDTTKSSFTTDSWGYSLQNETTSDTTSATGDTPVGNDGSTYSPLVSSSTSPITVMSRDTATSGSQRIWFGAKAGADKASGTYTGTIVLSVVTGDVTDSGDDPNNNPITPTDPVNPDATSGGTPVYPDNTPVYTGASSTTGVGSSGYQGTTVYNTRSSAETTEVATTQVSGGDTRSSYAAPHGVVENTAYNNVGNNASPIATGLAVTAGVAAASGLTFFILAKRKKDDDDEEEQQQ